MSTQTIENQQGSSGLAPGDPSSKNSILRSVSTGILPEDLEIVTGYGAFHQVDVSQLLASMTWGEAATIMDNHFGALAYLDANVPDGDLEPVDLLFSEDALAILTNLAGLLRRELAEFLRDLMHAACLTLRDYIEEAEAEDELDSRDMMSWANEARSFHEHALQNIAPGWIDGLDGWACFGLERPLAVSDRKEVA